MDEARAEQRSGQVYDPDDRTTHPFTSDVVTITSNSENLQRDLIDRRIAEFVLEKQLSADAVAKFKATRKLVHNDDLHYTDFIYSNPDNPEGKQVIETRPDPTKSVQKAMGGIRVISFDYRTPLPVQGPQKAA